MEKVHNIIGLLYYFCRRFVKLMEDSDSDDEDEQVLEDDYGKRSLSLSLSLSLQLFIKAFLGNI